MAKKKSPSKKNLSFTQISKMIDDLSSETEIVIENLDSSGFVSTDIYIMNALLSKSVYGGVPDDRITIFAGEPGTGKSYLLYNIARNAQKDDTFIVFIDTEHSVNKSVLSGFGIDTSDEKLKLISTNKVESLKIFFAKFLENLKEQKSKGMELPKIMIMLDSIGQLASDKEIEDAKDGKMKVDMTRAKSIKQMFRVINSDLGLLKIPLVATNHVYMDTNSFFPTAIMSGGKGAEYSASTIVFLSTAKLKTGNEDALDAGSSGVIVSAISKKNRMAKPKKVKFEIDHTKGTNRFKGLEYFCTSQNFDKIGIAKGKKVENKDGTIGIDPGGNKWYVRHLDKSFFEKQLFNKNVFTDDVLKELERIIYDYFDYASHSDDDSYFDDNLNDNLDELQEMDADFDDVDNDELFK